MYNQEEEREEEANVNKTGVMNVSNLCSAATRTRSCKEKAKTWVGEVSSSGCVVDGSQGSLSLKIASITISSPALDLAHLHVALLFRLLRLLGLLWLLGHPRPALAEALVTFLVSVSETHICRRARPREDTGPVCEDRVLAEWSVAIFLLELVTVQIFSGRLTPAHEEEMVTPKTHRICEN
jgi:hypothetical protein